MEQRKLRKTRSGLVVGTAMDKTIRVQVERRMQHPVYGKSVKWTKRFMVHDENNDCNVGDRVLIMETRPMSKNKRWRLVEIIERAK